MMKMDGRDRSECQNWEKMDIIVILEINLSHKKTKNATVPSSPITRDQKNVILNQKVQQPFFLRDFFRERNFSLKYHAIRSSAVFGTRREAALRGVAYAWVPDL